MEGLWACPSVLSYSLGQFSSSFKRLGRHGKCIICKFPHVHFYEARIKAYLREQSLHYAILVFLHGLKIKVQEGEDG